MKEWADAPTDGGQWELVVKTDTLDIVIPPGDAAFSQWMETWSGGGCQKRCDGQRQILRDVACSCPSDVNERVELAKQGKACKPTTRFNVLLPDIPDIGVWRLETHGWNAALELGAFQNLADVATNQGRMIRARLRIDHRTTKKISEDGKAETFKFTVPVVEISHSVGDMLQALGATVDDVAFSLPAPTEGRNIPGDKPALPSAPHWDIDDPEAGPLGTEAAEGTPVEAAGPPQPVGDASARETEGGQTPVETSPTQQSLGEGEPPATAPSSGLTAEEEMDAKDRLVSMIEQAIAAELVVRRVKLNEGKVGVKAQNLAMHHDLTVPKDYDDFLKTGTLELLTLVVADLGLEESIGAAV